jgi:hypothetical protein
MAKHCGVRAYTRRFYWGVVHSIKVLGFIVGRVIGQIVNVAIVECQRELLASDYFEWLVLDVTVVRDTVPSSEHVSHSAQYTVVPLDHHQCERTICDVLINAVYVDSHGQSQEIVKAIHIELKRVNADIW